MSAAPRKQLGKIIALVGAALAGVGAILMIWQNPGEVGPFIGIIGGILGATGGFIMRRASQHSGEGAGTKRE